MIGFGPVNSLSGWPGLFYAYTDPMACPYKVHIDAATAFLLAHGNHIGELDAKYEDYIRLLYDSSGYLVQKLPKNRKSLIGSMGEYAQASRIILSAELNNRIVSGARFK